MLCIYGFEILVYTLSYIKENTKVYSYLTLVIKIQRMYLHPRAPMLCI